MRVGLAATSTLVAGLGILLVSTPRAEAAAGYSYSVVGNPADVVTPTSGLLVLQGGGTDVDENFVRMGARSGGGDFVVIRASGTDAYNPYIYSLCSCDSVATIVFKNRKAAFQPFVIDTIRNAEALFIAGGDQSDYVNFWKNTPVEDAIHFVAGKPAPIGGTSAGMAVMSQFLYSAMSNSSLDSVEGLADPFHRDLTLDRDFLSLARLGGLITDQHLIERDRMGRTMAFLARLVHDGWTTEGRAIAADRETALHVNPSDGTAEVLSTPTHTTPYVYFLRTPGPPEVCAPARPLTYRNVAVYRIGPGGTFDLDTWTGTGGISYTLSAEAGVLTSSRGAIY
jgi:cyanophycinase-like exopeptidase